MIYGCGKYVCTYPGSGKLTAEFERCEYLGWICLSSTLVCCARHHLQPRRLPIRRPERTALPLFSSSPSLRQIPFFESSSFDLLWTPLRTSLTRSRTLPWQQNRGSVSLWYLRCYCPHLLMQFESFKMGGGAPPNSLTSYLPKHSHGRSPSRNSSISSLSTLSISASVSPPSLPSPHTSINLPSKRPTSHHRRRSSVSTRCESAELMGVSLPDLPPAHPDDNVNFGDKDSIRRRALWALEGKPDVAFSKVEIPDITSPDSIKFFDFRGFLLIVFIDS